MTLNSSVIVALLSIFGMVAVALWGKLDDKIENSWGATIVGGLLFAALGCSLSGHLVPEGALLLTLAVFVWLFTMIGLLDWTNLHKRG